MPQRFALSLMLRVATLAFAVSAAAHASIVFNNFGPGLTYDTGSGNPVGNAFDGNDYAQGNTFQATFSGDFQSLRVALSCAFACPDPVTVSLTADNGNQPGFILESFGVNGLSLGPIGTNNVPLLLSSVLHPKLTKGSQYWVTVGAGPTDSVAWNLNSTGDVSAQAISSDNGATWFSPSGNTPGALAVDAVPEPASFALLAGGSLLLGVFLRRRRTR